MHIVVVGSFIQACCWKVTRLPQAGETLTASQLLIEPGGKGLNVAIGARRLGADVDLLVGIGNDAAGNHLLDLLERERISTNNVWRLAAESGYGAGFIADDGQNMIALYPGPNQLLQESHAHLAKTAIERAGLVYAQFETSLNVIIASFQIARLSGVTTILNPSPWQSLPQLLLDVTDILLVNELEARELLKLSTPSPSTLTEWRHLIQSSLAAFWRSWRGKLLIVTLGNLGSIAFEGPDTYHLQPSFPVDAVDTVGAGDAFASGFCIALMRGKSIPVALNYANACGALVASHSGVLAALPNSATVDAFIAQNLG